MTRLSSRRIRAASFALALALVLGAAGCGKQSDWYEYSSEVDRQEREFVRDRMNAAGLSEVEAKKEFDLMRAIRQTEGREEVVIEFK